MKRFRMLLLAAGVSLPLLAAPLGCMQAPWMHWVGAGWHMHDLVPGMAGWMDDVTAQECLEYHEQVHSIEQ